MNNQEFKLSFNHPEFTFYDPEFKLSFNHPVKEIYPGISSDEIQYITKKIKDETDYKTGPIPQDVFSKYYTDYLTNKK